MKEEMERTLEEIKKAAIMITGDEAIRQQIIWLEDKLSEMEEEG